MRGLCFFKADEHDTYQRSRDKTFAADLIWEHWPAVVTQTAARLPALNTIRYGILASGYYGNTEIDYSASASRENLQKAVYDKLKALKHEPFFVLKARLHTLAIQPFFVAQSNSD